MTTSPYIIKSGLGMLLVILITATSCKKFADDYLDELPSKNTGITISSIADLEALLNNHTEMGQEGSALIRLMPSDDFADPTKLITDASLFFNNAQTYFYSTWDRRYMENLNNDDWRFQWKKIFTANLVLSSLPNIPGSETDKSQLKAEAHYIRAYAYWVLANTYCLPYTAENREEMGLPIKTTPSFEENVARVPLHKVYELIQQDLDEALKITQPIEVGGVLRPWRANVAGVNAFAARYYLTLGDYEAAERHASISLDAYNALVDFNNPAEISFAAAFPVYPSTAFFADPVLWKEFTSYRVADHFFMVPSDDLKAIYDHDNDMRYVYYFAEGGGALYGFPAIAETFVQLAGFYIGTGTTVGEAYVTKAEALARLNKVPEALTTVNMLRQKRIKMPNPPEVVNITAASQNEAIAKILEERRRELPLSMRWFDLRRLNHNDDPNDDKTLVRNFWEYDQVNINTNTPQITYTLEPGSRKYALMIPKTELIASQEVIQQNTY